MSKKQFVISGINIFEGGTLSVYYDCLDSLIKCGYDKEYEITAFVHKKSLFKKYCDRINIIELPKSRKNYINRFYYEYIYFYKYSKKRTIDVWLSIHDMTPNVKANKRYVYCHNPTPFLKRNATIRKLNKTVYYMSLFYKYLYKINIKKNTGVIVQQEWIRKEFKKMYNIENVIVARPNVNVDFPKFQINNKNNNRIIFIYSAYPRPFKNFEVICKACRALKDQSAKFEVWLTINGSENAYSDMIKKEYADVENIKWLGLISRDDMMKKYAESDYLIFPSVLETWGLPITEYEAYNKPIIIADLPYAHETVGNYDLTLFFDPYSSEQLATIIKSIIKNECSFKKHVVAPVEKPFAENWCELLRIIKAS